jgi:hypothetical protein
VVPSMGFSWSETLASGFFDAENWPPSRIPRGWRRWLLGDIFGLILNLMVSI